MNILIFEYITGGGMVGKVLPASLVKEGEVMLHAIASDIAEIRNVQVSVLRDFRLNAYQRSVSEYIVYEDNHYTEIIEAVSDEIDALMIVAPESDGLLARLCKEYSNRNFMLLNCTAESVELVSDKTKTHNYLSDFGFSQIPTYHFNDIDLIESEKIVAKPNDGVGCENIFLIEDKKKLEKLLGSSSIDNYIFQPYIQGENASISLLCWDGECKILSANIQNINIVGECLELTGCNVNALNRDAFIQFSDKLIKAFPGLRGYVGVDVLITQKEILFVELNPRLTTSYAGLKSACEVNAAELILSAFLNKKLPEFEINTNNSVVIDVGAEHAA